MSLGACVCHVYAVSFRVRVAKVKYHAGDTGHDTIPKHILLTLGQLVMFRCCNLSVLTPNRSRYCSEGILVGPNRDFILGFYDEA